MRVLLLGATGNLGRRLIPALLVHGHTVTAYVRSASKLRSLLPDSLTEKISIYEGDALDTAAVEDAVRKHNCDAVTNTSGTRLAGKEQILGKIAASVSSAAIRVGQDRGKPLRLWLIGGLGSLEYPSVKGHQIQVSRVIHCSCSNRQLSYHDWHPALWLPRNKFEWLLIVGGEIQDYMPQRMTRHMREVEEVVQAIPTTELEWSLLCVAFMTPETEKVELLPAPKSHNLIVQARSPPDWHDSWFSYVPFIGVYLNVFLNISPYTTRLEDVADMIAEDFAKSGGSEFVGQLVGMKENDYKKSV